MAEAVLIGAFLIALAAALNWGVNYDLKRLSEAVERHREASSAEPS